MTPAATPILAVEALEVRFGTRNVLRGLNLAIASGEIFGLLGPNGAGKTTLIRTICGRVTPTAGDVTIAGHKRGKRAALNHIGLVPQELALYMHLSVRENLVAFGRLSGLRRKDTHRAVDWALEAARLRERADDPVDILSGGWKRRVNIAAAILHNPSLLILDEPTVGVDVDARNELQDVIRDLSLSGMAVLLATHDLDQAETLCATVGFLRDGVIAPKGTPRGLIAETFEGQKEIILELRRKLTKKQRDALVRSSFIAGTSEMSWSVMGAADGSTSVGLAERLERVGILVREIRLREPGLDSLFLHLSRKKTDRAPMVIEEAA
ncbi:ABC-2 type transport system ATP-binding protein [Devosia enhydra]|uniref:ABC-2 type transport system ATP-binding protein n=1 Tax=Devosia enhydra TaxID=665118 RepID=A0A1K2HT70_9HYPH|nr:ABC transporter ATP-binding protein [Devosia enhydra]SFZ81211.1 ABC-2 type transport system ATP-binding protein [Devosia enhydra]